MDFIRGDTDLYLIPGNPVTNVRLPRMFNHVFDRFGVTARMVPVRVRARDFAVWMKASFLADNVKGMVLAPPHKPIAVPLLDAVGLYARAAGSVNVIRRDDAGQLEGTLFDGEGIVAALNHYHIPFRGCRVLILGAGVSGAAIGVSLAERGSGQGARELAFYDPIPGRAAGVAARIANTFGARALAVSDSDPAGYDLIINATPLGSAPDDPLPCDVQRIDSHAAIFDIVLHNQPTRLVQAARSAGLFAQPGFEMLVQQMPRYFDYFGMPDVAKDVRRNANLLRELIVPELLHNEIQNPMYYPNGISN